MKIQKTLTTVLLLAFTFFPRAFSASGTIKEDMKEMGKIFKKVSTDVQNPALNSGSIELVKKFQILLADVKIQVPASLEKLPEDQRAIETERFIKLISDLETDTTQLIAALEENDNAEAAKILLKMKETRKIGHEEFDNAE